MVGYLIISYISWRMNACTYNFFSFCNCVSSLLKLKQHFEPSFHSIPWEHSCEAHLHNVNHIGLGKFNGNFLGISLIKKLFMLILAFPFIPYEYSITILHYLQFITLYFNFKGLLPLECLRLMLTLLNLSYFKLVHLLGSLKWS